MLVELILVALYLIKAPVHVHINNPFKNHIIVLTCVCNFYSFSCNRLVRTTKFTVLIPCWYDSLANPQNSFPFEVNISISLRSDSVCSVTAIQIQKSGNCLFCTVLSKLFSECCCLFQQFPHIFVCNKYCKIFMSEEQ